MNKRKFIKTLKRRLWFLLPKREVKEIIRGYEEYFEQNQDKSEALLVAECGDIDLIIDEIFDGKPVDKHLHIKFVCLLILSLISTFFLSNIDNASSLIVNIVPEQSSFPLFYYLENLLYALRPHITYIIIWAVNLALFFLTIGQKTLQTPYKFSKKIYMAYVVNLVASIIIIFVFILAFEAILNFYFVFPEGNSTFHDFMYRYGAVTFANILTSFIALFMLAASYSLFYTVRIGRAALPLVFINILPIPFICTIMYNLKNMSLSETYFEYRFNIFFALTNAIPTLLLCAIFYAVIEFLAFLSRKSRRNKNDSST